MISLSLVSFSAGDRAALMLLSRTTFKFSTYASSTLVRSLPRLRRHFHAFSPFTVANMPSSKPQPENNSKVLVFGAGNFGSCLADHLGDSEHEVYIWAREEKLVKHFNEHHYNLEYLKDHKFSENIKAVGPEFPDKELVNSVDVLLFAIPTQFLRYASLNLSGIPIDIYLSGRA